MEHPEVIHHVGIYVNGPPGMAELPFISSSDGLHPIAATKRKQASGFGTQGGPGWSSIRSRVGSRGDFLATIFHYLGYRPETELHDTQGRPIPLSRPWKSSSTSGTGHDRRGESVPRRSVVVNSQ